MNIRKVATITVLVLSSFAATNVGPTKAELESMYDKAFREFNANNYPQALKELDAIDARQPDLAESQNLRGVILMRQADYDQAEAALQRALASDPKFWNARFNLAEIPFLRKDWAEARKRFDALLQGNAAELQGDAAQLIQYKILLTYLLQGNENMVDSILAKFELSPETPAANYANAAIAFQHKKEKEAKDLLATAEKNFSPQLNKLFAESLYEVGWIQKPVGQTRAALELTSAADRLAKAKALATEKYEQAEQAFQQRDLTAARRLVDEADSADPNQAVTINLRGEILLAQKDFDGAEGAFKQAAKLDPKMPEAQYNLAQIPFKKKDYAKARDRFEALYGATAAPGGDKNQTAQIIKFNIYLTLLLEGKDARAQKMMEQFKFTGDTPALYYAQAAWEFKHNNASKANDWIVSARKIYSPALNFVFADSFYDLGWLQNQSTTPATASTEIAKTEAAKTEAAPSIEASPIAAAVVTSDKSATQPNEIVTQKLPATVPGTEVTSANAPQSSLSSQPVIAKNESDATVTAPAFSSNAEAPVTSNALPAETEAASKKEPEHSLATGPATSAALAQQKPVNSQAKKVAAPIARVSKPTAALAPSAAQAWTQPSVGDRSNSRTLLVGALLLAGILLLAWVVISELRRRVSVSVYRSPTPATGPRFDTTARETTAENIAASSQLAGGPPQISLQLKASEPSVRRAAVPFGKMNRPFGSGIVGNGTASENLASRDLAPTREPEQVGEWKPQPVVENVPAPHKTADAQFADDLSEASEAEVPETVSAPEWEFAPVRTGTASTHVGVGPASKETPVFAKGLAPIKVVSEPATPEASPVFETVGEPISMAGIPASFETVGEPISMPETSAFVETVGEPISVPDTSAFVETVSEPISVPDTSAFVETVSEPISVPDTSAFVETVGEPVSMPETSALVETVGEPVAMPETSALLETVGEPISAPEAPASFEADESVSMEEKSAFSETVGEPITMPETPEFFETVGEPIALPSAIVAESAVTPPAEISRTEIEPVAQGQPIPYQVPAFSTDSPSAEITEPEPETQPTHFPTGAIAGVGGIRHLVEPPSFAPEVISTEPLAQQPTTPVTMSEQPTSVSAIRTAPMTGGAPQPASGMHTAVQLTFSFEIASMQLTPSFKMGALQLKPTSKIVTMRLAPSQQPQPAMNLQVTFEIASVQLAGNALGMIRLTPSQQQRPGVISSPAFNVAGLQLLSGAESGAVQITPSQQGQASVHVTGRFQIATVEFSPSFEIASIVLNSTSKNVSVQLPGAGPSAVEGAPVFEVSNVQLAGNGEIGIMQLTAQGAAPKSA